MDPTALAAENTQLKQTLAEVLAKLDTVIQSNEALALELAKLKRQAYGTKSERRTVGDDAQLSLLARSNKEGLEPPKPADPPKPAARVTPHGRRAPEGEPDETLAMPRPEACPRCKGALRDVGDATSTRIDWLPGR